MKYNIKDGFITAFIQFVKIEFNWRWRDSNPRPTKRPIFVYIAYLIFKVSPNGYKISRKTVRLV